MARVKMARGARAKRKNSGYLFFGDEASFRQWGSLSYTWAPRGKKPTVKTTGIRKGYKVFGLIGYWSGKIFSKGLMGKFSAESYAGFLREVLAKTRSYVVLIQDGARYHTCYNPIEMLWKKVKEKGVHLKFFATFESLVDVVDKHLDALARDRDEVLAFFGLYTRMEDI